VFITEYRFDITYMEGTPIDWHHVSGVRIHRSVKRCLNLLNHQFLNDGSPSTTSIPSTVYSCN